MADYNLTNLPIDTTDAEAAIMVESAISWVVENTTLELDPETELPANVKLFIVKYCDIMAQTAGVSSESLGGMSQSFTVSSKGLASVLADLAAQLFGSAYKGRNRFVSAVSKWQ